MRHIGLILMAGAAAVALSSTFSRAQNQQQTPPDPCTAEGHRAFDFWEGTWEVSAWGQEAIAGRNHIEGIEKGCALFESWISSGGGTGVSVNYYNPVKEEWRQVWISNGSGGYSIDIAGGLDEEGAMALEGEIYYYAQNIKAPFRGKWSLQKDRSVRQTFHQQNTQTGEWALWFDGRYVKAEDE